MPSIALRQIQSPGRRVVPEDGELNSSQAVRLEQVRQALKGQMEEFVKDSQGLGGYNSLFTRQGERVLPPEQKQEIASFNFSAFSSKWGVVKTNLTEFVSVVDVKSASVLRSLINSIDSVVPKFAWGTMTAGRMAVFASKFQEIYSLPDLK